MLKRLIYALLFISLFFITGCAGAGDYSIDLPGNLQIDRLSADDIRINSYRAGTSGSLVVPGKVSQVVWDDHYVLAKDVLAKEVQEGRDRYWIVHIETEESTGPLTEEEFLDSKSDLDISESIELKDLSEYDKKY